jgi:hypothetical protein
LFFKKKITEFEAAAQFILERFNDTREGWQTFVRNLNEYPGVCIDPSDEYLLIETSFALIALELEALPKLFSEDQENRIRSICKSIIRDSPSGDVGVKMLDAYHSVWNNPPGVCLDGLEGIAAMLSLRLGCRQTVQHGSAIYDSPTFGALMSLEIMKLGTGWWKSLALEYKVVND